MVKVFQKCSRKFGFFLTLLAYLFGYEAFAIAGIIKIETTTWATVADDLLSVRITVMNKGNEAAYNVQVNLVVLGEKLKSSVKTRLDKGQADIYIFQKSIPEVREGKYPLPIIIDFQDANKYPFSAVTCPTFFLKEDVYSDLICYGNDTSIEKNGLLRFKIRNRRFEKRAALATLLLPKELSAPEPQIEFEIGPRAKRSITFEINNSSALQGAVHSVFCYLEYDLETVHHTTVARANVMISEKENMFRQTRALWIALSVCFITILLIMIVRGIKFKNLK